MGEKNILDTIRDLRLVTISPMIKAAAWLIELSLEGTSRSRNNCSAILGKYSSFVGTVEGSDPISFEARCKSSNFMSLPELVLTRNVMVSFTPFDLEYGIRDKYRVTGCRYQTGLVV